MSVSTASNSNIYKIISDAAGNVGIGTTSPGSTLDVKGTLRLSGSTSGYVGFSPAAAAGSTTYTLPTADGTANQVLSTNGSGVLSWMANGAGATLAATNAWTGVNSFALKTSTSRLMGSTINGYPFDTNNGGTIVLSDATAVNNLARVLDASSTNLWATNDNYALVNTYGAKWTGIGFQAGTSQEVLRVASSLSMTSYTKWQNVNAVVVGYLNNGPRILIQDYDLETEQANTIRVLTDNVVFGTNSSSGGLSYQGIRTIADVATTLDHTYAYILLGGTGAYTITLPTALKGGATSGGSGQTRGRWYLFKKITATNVVTITAAAGQTIDGAASVTISTQWAILRIIAATDTEWFTV